MGRPPCRWWFLNPIEWLKAIYGAFGVKHPTISLIVVTLLSAMSGAAIWILGANLVAKEDAKKTGEPLSGESPEHESLSVQAQVYFPHGSPALTIRWNGPEVFVELTTDIIHASPFDLVATGIDGV
jgi:hypothetical protein